MIVVADVESKVTGRALDPSATDNLAFLFSPWCAKPNAVVEMQDPRTVDARLGWCVKTNSKVVNRSTWCNLNVKDRLTSFVEAVASR